MEEKSRAQELSVREISLIRELAQIRKEHLAKQSESIEQQSGEIAERGMPT